ncbi:MAG: hypothetical protein HOO19_11990 [Rhodospirillaceae bacterium]|jgi:hypothetical protein|nr:hypothetical protein [Rhodospirillaceae bacterium]MBT4115701.1 hypothetical protein [Rhodospirillaceae bacterium]MBT4673404.1 hypothetical protein [Rhodospirillaceae bacterium]MBT4750045.1 hypothetical protein [Rhodospirillaceae bacterium]MBT5181147.1 hypothetical protein [Rhodospirillaceae bacterium]
MANTDKLPVWGIMILTYRFFWAERRQFWLLAVPAIIVVSMLSALAEWSVARAAAERIDIVIDRTSIEALPVSAMFLTVIAAVASIWAYVSYSIAWHRSYLYPAENVTIGSCYNWGGRQWRFLGTLIKITILFAGATTLIFFGLVLFSGTGVRGISGFGFSSFGPMVMFAMLFAFALIGAVYARLSVWLPAVALDQTLSLGQVWALTRGNGWRLLAIIVLVTIPIGIILIPITVVMNFAAGTAPDYGPLTSGLVQNLMVQFLSYIYIALGISALSVCYARLDENNSG